MCAIIMGQCSVPLSTQPCVIAELQLAVLLILFYSFTSSVSTFEGDRNTQRRCDICHQGCRQLKNSCAVISREDSIWNGQGCKICDHNHSLQDPDSMVAWVLVETVPE